MNFVEGDRALELDVLAREIAAYPHADARCLAAYSLLAELTARRDDFGVGIAIDSSRQTLLHLHEAGEGISLIKDVGGAVTGLRVGPHNASEWHMLGLAREIAEEPQEAGRLASLSEAVHQTIIKGRILWAQHGFVKVAVGVGYAAYRHGKRIIRERVAIPEYGQPNQIGHLCPSGGDSFSLTIGRMEWERIVGKNVRRLRKERGLSQETLAGEAGLATRHIGRIERGEGNPTLSMLVKIAAVLGVHPGSLYDQVAAPEIWQTLDLLKRLADPRREVPTSFQEVTSTQDMKARR